MATLEIDRVRKAYGAMDVLKEVSISIDSGDFLVLLGPSGCGKSTLLNMIAGLEDITAGEIRIDGDTVNDRSPKDRDIAMVFQSYALYPTMTVRQNIEFGMKIRGVAAPERERATREAADLLQMAHLLDRKPSQLSGGQRQRVAMGRALVRHPKLFLFDEPLSNLDAKLRVDMRTEIKRLHQRLGTTIVYVTHDQIEAMTMATRIAVMKDGIIQQFGTPADIYERPANVFVATFMGSPAMNLIPARVEGDAPSRRLRLDDGTTLPFPSSVAPDAALPSDRVLPGLRPEWIRLAADDDPAAVGMHVEVIEPTGPDIYAELSLGGQGIMARLPANAGIAAGTKHRFAIDHDKTILFDQQGGQAI